MKKQIIGTVLGALVLLSNVAGAQAIRTPEGKMPIVHWVVMQSQPGKLAELRGLSDKYISPHADQNPGVYALYNAVDAKNPDVVRLLEIYQDEATIERHRNQPMFPLYLEARKPVSVQSRMLDVEPIALESKKQGTGNYNVLELFVVKPEELATFKQDIAAEMKRAVDKEKNVLGLFATAEKADKRTNYIHTMGIFTDKAAYDKYINSAAYEKYSRKMKSMLISELTINSRPENIMLTGKGFAK